MHSPKCLVYETNFPQAYCKYWLDAFSLARKVNGERRKICRKTSVERLCGQVIRTEDGQGQAFVIFRAEKSDAVYSAMG